MARGMILCPDGYLPDAIERLGFLLDRVSSRELFQDKIIRLLFLKQFQILVLFEESEEPTALAVDHVD